MKNSIRFMKTLQFCCSHREDPFLWKYLSSYGSRGKQFVVRALGNQNVGKFIYFIQFTGDSGFFALYRLLLQLLSFADKFGMIPVVEYPHDSPYAESSPVHGTTNPFAYFFEQPAGITPEEALQSRAVVFYEPTHNLQWSKGYLISEQEVDELARMQQKYIRLRPEVDLAVHSRMAALLQGKKTLGVHIRGTDYNRGFDGHPRAVSYASYFSHIDAAMKNYQFEQIFLATDDTRLEHIFRKRYSKNLVLYDHMRSSKDVSVSYCLPTDRKHCHYLLGLEVLTDMLTLSACDGLLAGPSQVSYAARIDKRSRKEQYEYLHTLHHGIYPATGNISTEAPERKQQYCQTSAPVAKTSISESAKRR